MNHVDVQLEFQSTQSSQTVTSPHSLMPVVGAISIHTALADCDSTVDELFINLTISIHTVLADCDVSG